MSVAKKIILFVETPANTKNFAFFRIAISIFCIIKMLVLFPVLNDMYGQYGIIQWAVSKAAIGPYLPHLGDMNIVLMKYFSVSAARGFYLLFFIYLSSLMCLAAGFLTRIMAILCWLQHLAWMNTGGAFMYGVDVFTQISLFYLLFMPANMQWSVDNILRIKKIQEFSVGGGIVRRVFQAQMCIMYFSSGLEKVYSPQWRNGESIWRAFMMPSFRHFDFTWMSHYTFLPMIIGWLTVLTEILYAFLVWIPKARVAALASVFILHIGIGLFMGMWFFSIVMIIISLFCFGEECYSDIKETPLFLTKVRPGL
jgi:hypothetical protein